MFIFQMLKILFIAAFLYMLYNLVVYVFKIGRIVREKRKEQEKRRTKRPEDRSEGDGRRVIELGKDQYKVE
jgi:hypothetical protein